MTDTLSIEQLTGVLFDAFKDRFKKADVWEGNADVNQLRFAAEMGAKVTHAILTAKTEAEKKHHEETLEIVNEAVGFKVVEKGIRLNKFGRDFLGEAIRIAAKTVVATVIGMI